MSVIIAKGNLYLNNRYQWGVIPHLFPTWQAVDVLELMQGTTQPATGYAVVNGKSIDLDALEVVTI